MSPLTDPLATTLRLTGGDFDAFLDGARSRYELRHRMLGWARGVVTRLAEIGVRVEASSAGMGGRSGRPDGERVVFALRQDRHEPHAHGRLRKAHLLLAIDAGHVEVGISVPCEASSDLANLRARLAESKRAHELAVAIAALPEQFAMGVSEDAACPPDAVLLQEGAGALVDLIGRVERTRGALWMGWSVPREVAIKHSALLDEQLEDAIVALGPAYKLIAWAKDNDLLTLDPEADERPASERTDRKRAKRRAKDARHTSVDGEVDGVAKRPHKHEVKDRHEPGRPTTRRGSRVRDADAGRPILRATHRDGPRITTSRSARPESSGGARLPTPGASVRTLVRRPAPGVDPRAAIEKGTRVRVLAGPFASKVGVVQDLDGKGGARVMLGLLATRVEVKDLIACTEGRERPALMSSHRKPLPAR